MRPRLGLLFSGVHAVRMCRATICDYGREKEFRLALTSHELSLKSKATTYERTDLVGLTQEAGALFDDSSTPKFT